MIPLLDVGCSQERLRTHNIMGLRSRHRSIVCFRFIPNGEGEEERLNGVNLQLVESLRATGRVFLSSTRLHGKVYLRFCFVNWRTTTADVEETVKLLASLVPN